MAAARRVLLAVFAVGVFAVLLFLYPYFQPMSAYLGRHISTQSLGGSLEIVIASAELKNMGRRKRKGLAFSSPPLIREAVLSRHLSEI